MTTHTTIDEPTDAGIVDPESQRDASLIRLNELRADPRFAGIDGGGETVVVIDMRIDLNHPFFGADADRNGVDDRIVFSYDFSGSNDANASDTQGHDSNVTSIIGSPDATYTGMAPRCNIIALKVFPDFAIGNSGFDPVTAAHAQRCHPAGRPHRGLASLNGAMLMRNKQYLPRPIDSAPVVQHAESALSYGRSAFRPTLG
jgi:hypothetical protein